MFNTIQYRLGRIRSQRYFERVERDRIINIEENTNVAGDGDRCIGMVGTVGTLQTRHLNSGKWEKDKVSMKQYNQLKYLEETIINPIKNFEDLTLEDICGDNIIMIVNEHFSRIIKQGMVPHGWSKPGGWLQESPRAIKPDCVIKGVEPLYQILKSAFPSHENLTGRTPQA